MNFTRFFLLGCSLISLLRAELRVPAIIGDHMVLQQKQANPIWGWDTPGTQVRVSFAGKELQASAGADGKWLVKLDPLPADSSPHVLTITGSTRKEIQDVLIGEVWMCSGQSNMGFPLNKDLNGDIDVAASKLAGIRLIRVPPLGTQELKEDFQGEWKVSNPETSKSFSAVGFYFGRIVHKVLGVPVGLIDNAWNGSSAEAWVRTSSLQSDPRFKALMERTALREAKELSEKGKADFERAMQEWKLANEKALAEHKTPPRGPQDWLHGNARPGNIFAGSVHPTLGYGIKGVIWYQGEGNAVRAYHYTELFSFMIEQWRKEWQQGDFPFYWVQLANFRDQKPLPSESDWAELREVQTKTQSLPNTGQAVIIDLGEADDVHPRNKHDVAARLARWALAKDYGINIPYHSPEFKALTLKDDKALVTIDCFGSTLKPLNTPIVKGFALCGSDRVWHWATGKVIAPDQVELTSAEVPAPMAVRYAWADNPVCNLYSADGLPVTPFRTDDFEMTTKPKPAAAAQATK